MRTASWILRRSACALPCIALVACVSVEEPPCPPVEVPGGEGECSQNCTSCTVEEMQGRVFRMTRLEIDEPAEFASLLNGIWETDIDNQTLNVLFYVSSAERSEEEVSAFTRLEFVAGPGWRTPTRPLALHDEPEGLTAEDQVDSFCMLEGLDSILDGTPYHGKQCEFKSTEMTALYFHSGPKDYPLVCAPANLPGNSIPIKNLKVRMGFNDDCTEIRNAFIEGCITIPDADRICMCMGTGKCPYPDGDKGPPPLSADDLEGFTWPYGWIETPAEGDALEGSAAYQMLGDDGVPLPAQDANDRKTEYCHTACGPAWISFGGSVDMFQLAPTCQTPDGRPGYRLQGFFDAKVVTEKYNPVQSSDCSG
ncbi:MAG: hypothetical protein FJ098_11900, partial [Deltaproteobacteria bacterium]|nr:hypothetical protein [Deltaproteobacteria bacterium]